jgi:hypothetical protein
MSAGLFDRFAIKRPAKCRDEVVAERRALRIQPRFDNRKSELEVVATGRRE